MLDAPELLQLVGSNDLPAVYGACRDIEPFLPGIADDFDDYLVKMSQPGVWGGERGHH
jgi:hypothetical protein